MFDFAEKTSDMTAIEILNYYRNLYYAEPQVAERGIVANAINDMLGLINRQKAEVERYKRYYYRHEYDKWEKEIKTGAYKEFAEKFKKELLAYRKKCRNALDNESVFVVDKVRQMIDNLLKEMVGEK